MPIFGSSIASEAMPSGTLIQKIIDQCRCSANTPPMIGPPIPAAVHTPEKYAWYWPRSRGVTMSEITVCTMGRMPPPPRPCRPRATISIGMFGATAHSTEPRMNSDIAAMIMALRP